MANSVVGIRELKNGLSAHLRVVKEGGTVLITERGKPIGRIVPISTSIEAKLIELVESGVVVWNGQRVAPLSPLGQTKGERTVADLLLEDRE